MVMVKPGMPYLDIVRRVSRDFPGADLRLSGVRRIRDADGSLSEWLAQPRTLRARKPDGLPPRGRLGHPHIFRGRGGPTLEGSISKGHVTVRFLLLSKR